MCRFRQSLCIQCFARQMHPLCAKTMVLSRGQSLSELRHCRFSLSDVHVQSRSCCQAPYVKAPVEMPEVHGTLAKKRVSVLGYSHLDGARAAGGLKSVENSQSRLGAVFIGRTRRSAFAAKRGRHLRRIAPAYFAPGELGISDCHLVSQAKRFQQPSHGVPSHAYPV